MKRKPLRRRSFEVFEFGRVRHQSFIDLMLSISNPFSTRCVRPGAVPFLYPDELVPETLMGRLMGLEGRGAIVGPHGCGKTTLLLDLARRIEQSGQAVHRVMIDAGSFDFAQVRNEIAGNSPHSWVALDGFDQLSGRERSWVIRYTRKSSLRLLVTAHSPCRLPTLVRLTPCVISFERVVSHLCADLKERDAEVFAKWMDRWTGDAKQRLFQEHHGDIREALFSLYDDWEQFAVMETTSC